MKKQYEPVCVKLLAVAVKDVITTSVEKINNRFEGVEDRF